MPAHNDFCRLGIFEHQLTSSNTASRRHQYGECKDEAGFLSWREDNATHALDNNIMT